MQQFSEFVHMGGYAAYVWSAYGLFLVTLVMNFILPLKTEKKLLRATQKRLEKARRKS